jgi:hypothetical protein
MELPNLKNLQKLINFCRKNKINHVKFGDFEFQIDVQGFEKRPYTRKTQTTDNQEIQEESPKYSDLDVLLWSVGGIPNQFEGEQLDG